MNKKFEYDVVIWGGGVAGLFCLARAVNLGYKVCLLNQGELGWPQTVHAQGIIHGGVKYSIQGKLTHSTTAIESMPERWQSLLQGQAEIDLSRVQVLSRHHDLISRGGFTESVSSFIASKAIKSQSKKLKPEEYPEVFQNSQFSGQIFRVYETVVDPKSLLFQLAAPYQDRIFQYQSILEQKTTNGMSEFVVTDGEHTVAMSSKQVVVCAGAGNEGFLAGMHCRAQRRPLHMVALTFEQEQLPLYAHWLGMSQVPLLTVTTHPSTVKGQTTWYLGGQIAEDGCERDAAAQIETSQKLLAELLPWVDTRSCRWHTMLLDRAEAKQPFGHRPTTSLVHSENNWHIVWPTKLTFAPTLWDNLGSRLWQTAKPIGIPHHETQLPFAGAKVATQFWELNQ